MMEGTGMEEDRRGQISTLKLQSAISNWDIQELECLDHSEVN